MAIEKKHYTPFDLQAIRGLDEIYKMYFTGNNCQDLLHLLNKYSVADAILQSGNTSILLEYKRRTGSFIKYPTVIIEKLKYDKLKSAAKLFDAKTLFISDYDDGVLIYDLKFNTNEQPDYIDMPVSNSDPNYLDRKPVFHLPVLNADIVIGKKEWKRATEYEIKRYIQLKSA